jgi:hypothetical protein
MKQRKKRYFNFSSIPDERATNALLIVGGLLAVGVAAVMISKKPAS